MLSHILILEPLFPRIILLVLLVFEIYLLQLGLKSVIVTIVRTIYLFKGDAANLAWPAIRSATFGGNTDNGKTIAALD